MSKKQGEEFISACQEGRMPEAKTLLGRNSAVLHSNDLEHGMCLAGMHFGVCVRLSCVMLMCIEIQRC